MSEWSEAGQYLERDDEGFGTPVADEGPQEFGNQMEGEADGPFRGLDLVHLLRAESSGCVNRMLVGERHLPSLPGECKSRKQRLPDRASPGSPVDSGRCKLVPGVCTSTRRGW